MRALTRSDGCCAAAVALRGFGAAQGWRAEVYLFLLTVPDLVPNIGLYWYFFIELFEFFRPLFLVAFLCQPLVRSDGLTQKG